MAATEALELLRREIARKMEYHAAKFAESEGGDILYHGGAHDTLRDLQALVGESDPDPNETVAEYIVRTAESQP